MKDYERNLQRFSDMEDVEVAEEDPDVRGWDVVTRDGRDIGEVKDLLVDLSSMKVRCLEVELEGSQFKWNDNRRVAIPVESVQLDEEHDDVIINGMAQEEIGGLDEYRPAHYGSRAYQAPGSADRLTRSEEELRVGKREVKAGEVRVRKEVETEHVSQPVERARERVRIERRPVSEPLHGREARIENDEIRVPVTEEELVVEKRPAVKEELVISKDRVSETEDVDAELRKERFDIDKQGRVLNEDNDPLKGRR